MQQVESSCYTRLGKRIENFYTGVIAFGNSIAGRIALAVFAENAGAYAGQYLAERATSTIEEVSSWYPVLVQGAIGTTGAVVLYGVYGGRRYRLHKLQNQRDVLITLIAALYLPASLCVVQGFAYLLTVNQMVGRILGGFVGLTLTCNVPILWEEKDKGRWRSTYGMRSLRYEVVGRGIALIPEPKTQTLTEWMVWKVLFFLGKPLGVGMQLGAYHADTLVPFIKQSVRNLRLEKKKVIPLVSNMLVEKYMGKNNRKLIDGLIDNLYKTFSTVMTELIPTMYRLILQAVPTNCKESLESTVKKGASSALTSMNAGLTSLVKKLEADSEFLLSVSLRSCLMFNQVLNGSKGLKEYHAEWEKAFLEKRFNDQGIAERKIIKELETQMNRRYQDTHLTKYALCKTLVKSGRIQETLQKAMLEVPKAEKTLIGFTRAKPMHLTLWQNVCSLYLPFFLTMVASEPTHTLSAELTLMEKKQLPELAGMLVCHFYIDRVIPSFLLSKLKIVLTKAGDLREVAAYFFYADEQQTMVAATPEGGGKIVVEGDLKQKPEDKKREKEAAGKPPQGWELVAREGTSSAGDTEKTQQPPPKEWVFVQPEEGAIATA